MVGDRGMVSQKAIDGSRGQGGIDWITALKSVSIRCANMTCCTYP